MKNEYKSLKEFTSQYIGEWGPSDGHWLGLDFIYNHEEYRLHTGCMYEDEADTLFSLYKKLSPSYNNTHEYLLLEQFDSMDKLLDSSVIDNHKFKDIIIDSNTELIGQD